MFFAQKPNNKDYTMRHEIANFKLLNVYRVEKHCSNKAVKRSNDKYHTSTFPLLDLPTICH